MRKDRRNSIIRTCGERTVGSFLLLKVIERLRGAMGVGEGDAWSCKIYMPISNQSTVKLAHSVREDYGGDLEDFQTAHHRSGLVQWTHKDEGLLEKHVLPCTERRT